MLSWRQEPGDTSLKSLHLQTSVHRLFISCLIVDVVKLILVSGGVSAYRRNGGVTALMWAAKEGQKETARLLIEANADLRAIDKYCALSLPQPHLTPTCSKGKTALVHAACAGQKGFVRWLLEGRSHDAIVRLLVV